MCIGPNEDGAELYRKHLEGLPCPSCGIKFAAFAELVEAGKEVVDNCPYCNGEGFTVTTGTGMEHDPNDPNGEPIPVPIPIQEQCQFCYSIRAALRRVEGKK